MTSGIIARGKISLLRFAYNCVPEGSFFGHIGIVFRGGLVTHSGGGPKKNSLLIKVFSVILRGLSKLFHEALPCNKNFLMKAVTIIFHH